MVKQKHQHKCLIFLFISFVLLTIMFSLGLPLGEAADERDHFTLVRFITEQRRIPLTLAERTALGDKGDASPLYHSLVAYLSQHTDITALPNLPLQLDPVRYIPDDMPRTNMVYHTEDESYPFRGIVLAWHLGRLVSIPLSLLTLLGIYLTTIAIYPHRPYFALAVTGFAAFVPRFVINSSVITDDNLVVPLITFSIYQLTRIIQGHQRPADYISLGSLIGLASIVKYHALGLLLEASVVLLWLAWRQKDTWPRYWYNVAWLMMGFCVTAGWWFIFLWSRFNQVTELGWWAGLLAPLGDPVIAKGSNTLFQGHPIYWTAWIQPLFETFWFVYGGTQILASPFVYQLLTGITLIAGSGLILCLLEGSVKTEGLETNRSIVVIWLLGLHLAIYLGIIFIRFQINPTILAAQGRHLYPALISVSFFIVLGWSHLIQTIKGIRQQRRTDIHLAWLIPSLLISLNLFIFFTYIQPVYRPYLPIMRQPPSTLKMTAQFEQEMAEGIQFVGYRVDGQQPQSGKLLPITLYWQATDEPQRDHLVSLCMHNQHNIRVICHRGYPAEGRYPTRAWENGYLVRDQIYLALPACLTPNKYTLKLQLEPLRDDVAEVKLDRARYRQSPLVLGDIMVTNSPRTTNRVENNSTRLCSASKCYTSGNLQLNRIRQSIELQITQPQGRIGQTAYPDKEPYFRSRNLRTNSQTQWHPLRSETTYNCGPNQTTTTYNFILQPTIPSGTYHLIQPQAVTDLSLEIDVPHSRKFTPPKTVQTKSALSFGDSINLIGYEITPKAYYSGETIEVVLYWKALKTQRQTYYSSLHLLDTNMDMWAQNDQLLGGPYMNVLWTPGEIIRQTHQIRLNSQVPPGLHQLELGVYAYEQQRFEHLPIRTRITQPPVSQKPIIAQIRVLNPKHQQQPDHALRAKLGPAVTLIGYDLSAHLSQDETLKLSLYWLGTESTDINYTVFTQLIGPDGRVWAQQDNQPQQGRYPTSVWQIGEQVIDNYELTLRDGAPLGGYQLYIGMYDLSTGKRLDAVPLHGSSPPEQAILLQDFSLTSP